MQTIHVRSVNQPLIYTRGENAGVTVICIAGAFSITAVCYYATRWKYRPRGHHYTHVFAYFVSLLVANTIQALGAVLNVAWIADGAVEPGALCGIQGAVKNAGNVGTALWSFMLALHLFRLLFLRSGTSRVGLTLMLACGWTAVLFVPFIGVVAIQDKQRGPYFSVSGLWCWITDEYPREQTFMEYFFEFLAAFIGFIFYTAILLRVRGNLIFLQGRWRLRLVPAGYQWQLACTRDDIDQSMLRVAAYMVWYPVAYSIILIPVALSRLTEFSGRSVPMWAIILTDVIFNSTGTVNVCLMFTTRRLLPDHRFLPDITTPRKEIDFASPLASGVTPFTLAAPADAKAVGFLSGDAIPAIRQVRRPERVLVHEGAGGLDRAASIASVSTVGSVVSDSPLLGGPVTRPSNSRFPFVPRRLSSTPIPERLSAFILNK